MKKEEEGRRKKEKPGRKPLNSASDLSSINLQR